MAEKPFNYITEVHKKSRAIMGQWYEELGEVAGDDRPTGYLMISGNCVEILRSFDMYTVFPEVDALQMAIHKESLPMILKAEEDGYSSDNCAYVKADVGYFLSGGIGPGGTLPKPTLLVCNYVGCNVYIKWFEHLAEMTGAPLVMIDVPFARTTEIRREDIEYVVAQLKDLIVACEAATGKPYDEDRLREILMHSARAEEGWHVAKSLCKRQPAPFDAYFDAINLMGPINVLRGTKEAADFFDFTVETYRQFVEERKGPIPEERFRVIVEGPPPYPYYREFRDLFSRWGAVGVASTYSCVGGLWDLGFQHDPENPLESIATFMLWENLTNRSLLDRSSIIERYVEEWKADALVIHSVKSCRLFSAGQGDMRDFFINTHKLPTLMLESDLEDPRYFSEAQIRNRIDAFFESLEHQQAINSTTPNTS